MLLLLGTISTPVMIIICVAALLMISLAAILLARYRRSQRLRSASLYVEALKELIKGQEENAFRYLKQVVAEDTGNFDAYLKLGDIFRRRGEAATALKIHRQLTVRADLGSADRLELLKSLAQDYMEVGKEDRAIAALQEFISQDRKNIWAYQQLLHQYEKQDDWPRALSVQETILKITGQKDNALLALYETQIGHQWAARKEYHKARQKYKDALRRDRGCVPAYLGLGDAYRQENRLKEAIDSWKELLANIPEKASLAFERLEKALYEQGHFGDVLGLYRDLLERDPNNLNALLALVNIYEKKGDVDEAIRTCKRALQVEPTSAAARQFLVKFYQLKGDQEKVLENLEALCGSSKVTTQRFVCRKCGYESGQPIWHCPQCGQWRTFGL
jgi:lipopolysaccharide biosynthesis regulator YciM